MDVIEWLESIGADARVRHGSGCVLEDAVTDAGIDPQFTAALIARDCAEIYRLLGQGPQMAVQVPADDEEAPDEDDREADERMPGVRP